MFEEKLESLIKQRILDNAFDDKKETHLEEVEETINKLDSVDFTKHKGGLQEEYETKFKSEVLGLDQTQS